MNILIAFGNDVLFNISNLKKLKIEKKIIYLLCPFDFIHFIFSLKDKIFLKSDISLKNKTEFYLKKNIPGLKIKHLKPNIFEIIYFFPLSLINAIINTINLFKILIGNKAYLYSKNIDITGYCLDSLQRFTGSKFKIEEKINILGILVSFVYLLSLEIYINWFISAFPKKNIKKIIINHNVYAESGLFADFGKLFYKSDIFLNKRTYKDNIKFIIFKKSFLNYIPDLKTTKKTHKQIYWYEKNSIKQNKNFKNKKIDKSKILIIMHAFSDASHIHYKYSKMFQTYYQWVNETLKIAKSLKNQQFVFRSHPSSHTFYKNDERIISKLFKNLPKNIKLEKSNLVDEPLHHFKRKLPIIITYKGSIILEMGCSGINVVSMESRGVGFSSIIPTNLTDYKKILQGRIDRRKFYLKKNQILKYKKIEANLKNFLLI